ncbi:MAG: phosphoribosylanthranilate isomerase [Vicinamibacterales bacterium]
MSPRVKVCGLTRMADALLACELGADALGFVFWPGSPRFVDPEQVRAIAVALPPFVATVGVFVNQTPDYVAAVASIAMLSAIQLHGDEDPAAYAAVARRTIKSVAVSPGFDAGHAVSSLSQRVTMLLDAHDPIRRGGTGRTIDWHLAAAVARLRPVILSGGLTPENVASAQTSVRPYALDVSSGVEAAPGVKDPARLRAFFAALAPPSSPRDESTRATYLDPHTQVTPVDPNAPR